MLMYATLILGGDSPHGCATAHRFYAAGNAVVLAGADGEALADTHRVMHRTDWVKPVVAAQRGTQSGAAAAAVAMENYGGIARVVSLVHLEDAPDVVAFDEFVREARGAASAAQRDCPILFVLVAPAQAAVAPASAHGSWHPAHDQHGAGLAASEHSLLVAEKGETDESGRIADRIFAFCTTATTRSQAGAAVIAGAEG